MPFISDEEYAQLKQPNQNTVSINGQQVPVQFGKQQQAPSSLTNAGSTGINGQQVPIQTLGGQGGIYDDIVNTPAGDTNTEDPSGLEPGTHAPGPHNDVAEDFWGELFGGIEGEKNKIHGEDLTIGQALLGGETQRQQSRDFVYGPQDQFAQSRYYPYLNNLYDQNAQDPQSLVAPFDPVQQAGQQLGVNTAQNVQGGLGNVNQALNQSLDPSSAFSGPLYQQALASTFNPFIRGFQNDIQPVAGRFQEDIDNTMRNFNQNVLPGIRSQAVGVGQVGSSREGIAQGIAGQDLAQTAQGIGRGVNDTYQNLTRGFADNLGNISSQFAQNAFNQGIGQRQSALGLAPQIGQFNFLPSQFLQGIGADRQAQQQQYLNSPFDLASRFQQLQGDPVVLNESQSKGISQRGVSEGFGDIFGGGGGGALGGMFSDRRLKRNIRQLGTVNGLTAYAYDYVWGQPSIGYMADEVPDQYVVKHPSGYDMINYGDLL